MTTTSYPLRIDERIMPLVDLKAKDEYIDKSTAIRKLLYKGVEDYVLELYKEGRMSIGRVAELLNKSVYEVHRLIQKKNIKIEHSATIYRKSKETAKELFYRRRWKKSNSNTWMHTTRMYRYTNRYRCKYS